MMDDSILFPLRIPTDTPFATELEAWLRHVHSSNAGTKEGDSAEMARLPLAEECKGDIQRLAEQRAEVRKILLEGYEAATKRSDVLWTYVQMLAAFSSQGFAAILRKEYKKKHRRRSDPNIKIPSSSLEDSLASLDAGMEEDPPIISFGWIDSSINGTHTHDNVDDSEIAHDIISSPPEDCMLLEWEQANLMWTFAILEIYQAQTLAETATSSPTWKKVMAHYTTAANWLAYMQQEFFGASTLSNQQPTQYLWSIGHTLTWEGLQMTQALWTATAQRIGIEVFNQALLKAKLSTAAVQLYEECQSKLQENAAVDPYWNAWLHNVQLWIPYCQALAQSHQAAAHTTRQELTLAYQRFRHAIALAEECQILMASYAEAMENHEVARLLPKGLEEWQGKCAMIVEETPSAAATKYDEESLPTIPPQKVVKMDLKVVSTLVDKATHGSVEPPLFASLLTKETRVQVRLFQAQMDTLLNTTIRRADEKAEAGRRVLALHDLPHALTAYQQSVQSANSSGGLPDDVWDKIQALQSSNKMNRLQQELWELKDMADMTQQTFQKINTLLDEDLQMDQEFRRRHPEYAGHDVSAVQTKYRQALQNYQALMETAQNSDAQLLRRLEELPTDTKFKLLSKSKTQLDCLLPASAAPGRRGSTVDVAPLNKALAALSDLFRERDELVQELTTAVQRFNLMEFVQEVVNDPPERTAAALQGIFQSAQESLQDMVQDIQQNMLKQTKLVKQALDENVRFVKAREEQEKSRQQTTAAAGISVNTNRTLVMIHQAIEEVEELSKYLEEGKTFYNVVLPKLRRLQQNVEDLSTRLTIARCEYEDKHTSYEQQAHDAEVAATLREVAPSIALHAQQEQSMDAHVSMGSGLDPPESGAELWSSSEPNHSNHRLHRPDSDPDDGERWNSTNRLRVESVTHDLPDVRVDDAKVAHLVGMDFDPERVVEALKKYDNNLEQALNDLLMG